MCLRLYLYFFRHLTLDVALYKTQCVEKYAKKKKTSLSRDTHTIIVEEGKMYVYINFQYVEKKDPVCPNCVFS